MTGILHLPSAAPCRAVDQRGQAGAVARWVAVQQKSMLATLVVLHLLSQSTLQVNTAAEAVYELVDAECNLIFGAVVDPSLQQEVSSARLAQQPLHVPAQ